MDSDRVEIAPPALFGRTADLEAVQRHLTTHRVVTMTGPAGCGKTHLAQQVKWEHEHSREWYDTVVWVDLVAVGGKGDQVATRLEVFEELADALGLRTNASLVGVGEASLEPRVVEELATAGECLVVFDNCEHVLEVATGCVISLLGNVPHLRVLATSQRPLRVPGERCYGVAPFSLPDPEDPDAGSSPAVRMLAAHTGDPRFDIESPEYVREYTPELVRLADRVGGLPLALQGVARHVAISSPADVLVQLDRPAALLRLSSDARKTRDSHTRMDRAAEWMWKLADPQVQVAWTRLAALPGSVAWDTAVMVIADPPGSHAVVVDPLDAPEVLAVLVESSILQMRRVAGQARYTMPEVLRAYGQLQLAERGEVELVQAQALRAYEQASENATQTWFSTSELRVLKRWPCDRTNVAWVLDFAMKHDPAAGLRIMIGCMASRGGVYEGRIGNTVREFQKLLSRMPDRSDPALMAQGYGMLGWLLALLGDREGATTAIDTARDYERAGGVDLPEVALSHGIQLWWTGGCPREALQLLRRAVADFGDERPAMRHMARLYAALCAAFSGLTEANGLASIVVQESEARGGQWAQSWASYALMVTWIQRAAQETGAARQRLLDQAHERAADAARLWQRIDDRFSPLWALVGLTWVAAEQRRPRMTAMLLGTAQRVERLTDERITSLAGPKEAMERAAQYARSALSEEAYVQEFERGLESSERVSLDLALAGGELASGDGHEEQHPLPPGIWRIASFLREQGEGEGGLPSNAEIARWAQVSVRTVGTYFTRAYATLGIEGSGQRETLARYVRDWYSRYDAQHGHELKQGHTVTEVSYAFS